MSTTTTTGGSDASSPDREQASPAIRTTSLRKRRQCPHCGQWTFRPLNHINGWCIECTKELHMADLAEQAEAMKEEASREIRNNRTRQCFYSAKSRAKKKKNSHGKSHG